MPFVFELLVCDSCLRHLRNLWMTFLPTDPQPSTSMPPSWLENYFSPIKLTPWEAEPLNFLIRLLGKPEAFRTGLWQSHGDYIT